MSPYLNEMPNQDCLETGHIPSKKTDSGIDSGRGSTESAECPKIPVKAQFNNIHDQNLCTIGVGMEPIAIIGFSLRFPQDATSPQKFWKMLMEKRSAMTDVPADRFNIDAFYGTGEDDPGEVRLSRYNGSWYQIQ